MAEGLDRAVELLTSVLLFALVVGLAYATSRFLGGRLGWTGGHRRLLRVVAALPLGRDRQLLLVDVAGSYFLVGSGPQGVGQLVPIADPATLEQIRSAEAPAPAAAGFAAILTRVARGAAPPGSGAPAGGAPGAGVPGAGVPEAGVPGAGVPALDRPATGAPATGDRLAAAIARLRRLGRGSEA